MKRVTASEARRLWFRLLDEVLDGEVVVITRRGRKIVIRREDPARGARPKLPDYAHIIRVPESDTADTWRWYPFDRLIAAHSAARRTPLCSVDRTIRLNHPWLPEELSP